jgi:ATP-dependent helicase/nuclease subunit B
MRAKLGLSPLERALGLAAHDFVQAACAEDVVLSRAVRAGGTPSVPSRWLMRLGAMLASDARWSSCARDALATWTARLDDPGAPAKAAEPPRPCPPVEARPRRLSVTSIETWIRDPYAIFARTVLRLRPLERIDADPGAGDRGEVIHRALDHFIKLHGAGLPADGMAVLERLGKEAFGRWLERPSIRAFWWPRYQRIAAWFLDFEAKRRAEGLVPVASEATGDLTVDGLVGPFVLTATADRLDRDAQGRIHVLDYKTGQVPSAPQIETGLAAQLPLEAAILRAGGFAGIAGDLGAIGVVHLTGGTPAGELRSFDNLDPITIAEKSLGGLRRRVRAFDDPSTPYLSRPVAKWARQSADYDHLARYAEWSSSDGDES